MLIIFGVGGKLVNEIKRVQFKSKMCVRINEMENQWFNINRGVRLPCVMSTRIRNLFMG